MNIQTDSATSCFVGGELGLEGGEVFHGAHGAEPAAEADLEVEAVDVFAEVEDVGFDDVADVSKP